jgi:hypothetical protein
MENVSIAAADDGNRDAESNELARLLAELVRAGWQLHFQLVPNDWMAVSQAEIVFERAWNTALPRTAQEDMQALKQGFAPQAPVHWKFDPFDPLSIHKSVRRFHQLFVENGRIV